MDQNNTPQVSVVALMRQKSQLIGLVREKAPINPAAPMSGMKVARVSAKILDVLKEMGAVNR